MATLQVATRPSSEDVLRAADQLSSDELDQLLAGLLAARARRNAPSLSARETELMLRINEGIRADLNTRYRDLIGKRRACTLTPEEHAELISLGDQVEELDVRRVEALVELARLRGKTLPALMDDLGIRAPGNE